AKLFTERLLDLRRGDPSVPLPVLFDLRDVSVEALPAQPTLATVVEALLAGTDQAGQVSVEQVLAAIDAGNCLVIFDGLDEVLVHLSPHRGQLFIRALWRAARPGGEGRGGGRAGGGAGAGAAGDRGAGGRAAGAGLRVSGLWRPGLRVPGMRMPGPWMPGLRVAGLRVPGLGPRVLGPRSGRPGCCSPAGRTTSARSATRSATSPGRTGTGPPAGS